MKRTLRQLSTAAPAAAFKRNSQLWGFYPQSDVATLLSEQKIICNFMHKLQRQDTKDTAKEFGLEDEAKLKTGLALAYKRVAQIFEQAVPGSFELNNSDLVAPALARQLDYQLELFQKQKKLPRLNLHHDIKVDLVGMWVFPKYTREVLKSVGNGQYWEYYQMLPFYFRAQFYNLFLYLPGQRELVLGVEYTVKERLDLVGGGEEGQEVGSPPIIPPPRKYADEFIGDGKSSNLGDVQLQQEAMAAASQQPAETTAPEEESGLEEHKHYFVFIAQIDDNAPPEQEPEFVLTTINEPFDFLLGM